jgi:transcriptional regulator with XRE-family HTH domain
MAKLGVVSEEQFRRELKDCSQVASLPKEKVIEGIVLPKVPLGRGVGNVEVPEELKKLIGAEAIEHGREAALNLARDFGISSSSVSAYTNGATSTASYNNPDATLTKYLEGRKKRITKKSLRVLQSALSVLTPEKLNGIKARDASAIAKDMSVISKNMEKQDQTVSEANRPQFVVYAPQVRDERTYETIVVSDNF